MIWIRMLWIRLFLSCLLFESAAGSLAWAVIECRKRFWGEEDYDFALTDARRGDDVHTLVQSGGIQTVPGPGLLSGDRVRHAVLICEFMRRKWQWKKGYVSICFCF